MIKSMTGYGSAMGSSGKIDISVEIKSVNSRYLDCTIKLPRTYAAFEEKIKSTAGGYVSRGKVDIYINVDASKSDDIEIRINRPLAQAYIASLRELAQEHGLDDKISVVDLARFPEILHAEKRETDSDMLCSDICITLENALCGFNEMRSKEGKALRDDILCRLDEIEKLVEKAEMISPRIAAEYATKLETRMRDLLQTADIDDQRILLEAAIFADKIAINEETVRLKSHVAQLRDLLGSAEPVGRKIDFLVQEFNREANTIGSKGNDAEIARVVVDIKAEIEKIREQAQNIE